MKAMILAAGRGQRMGMLTDNCPKPLLKAGDKMLIEHQLERLVRAGITECVINVFYYAEKIMETLGNGKRYGLTITYSIETEKLETAGGIIQALPLLGSDPFVLMSSDVLCDYPLENLTLRPNKLAHLVFVDNPTHHPEGDFSLDDAGVVIKKNSASFTYGNLGLYDPKLFESFTPGYRKLSEVLQKGVERQQVTGEHYQGRWVNADTPERLASITLYS